MNIELLLRQYLYQHKSISLPGLGKLQFAADAQLPNSVEKNESFLLQGLNFTYNLAEIAEPEFVKFVSLQTGKIHPLAAADVDSYFMLCRQFINLGKAFTMEGIGAIEKNDGGSFVFAPSYYLPILEGSNMPQKPLKVRETLPVLPKQETSKKKANHLNKQWIFIAICAVGILIIGWLVYYFAFAKKNSPTPISTQLAADTSQVNKQKIDSAQVAANNTQTAAYMPTKYKAVFEQTLNKTRALKRYGTLKSFKEDVYLETIDSISFKLWVPIIALPADTLKKKDSLSKYFARKVSLEKM